MKKIVISALFILFLIFPFSVHAQGLPSTEFDEALKVYQLTLEEYNAAHDEYILARSQYLRFGTLSSQNKAKEATREMLKVRDQAVIDYLLAIKARINIGSGIEQSIKDRLMGALDEDVTWFTDHKASLDGAGSLEDLVDDSVDARKRFTALGPLVYESLAQIAYGRVERFHDRLGSNFLATKEKVGEIREEEREEYKFSVEKLQDIDRGLFQTEEKIQRSLDKLNNVVLEIDKFPGEKKTIEASKKRYDTVISSLGGIMQDLKDGSLYMKEIINKIKTK